MLNYKVDAKKIQRVGLCMEKDGIWKVMVCDGDVWECVTEKDSEASAKKDYNLILHKINKNVKEMNANGDGKYEVRVSNGGNTVRIRKLK